MDINKTQTIWLLAAAATISYIWYVKNIKAPAPTTESNTASFDAWRNADAAQVSLEARADHCNKLTVELQRIRQILNRQGRVKPSDVTKLKGLEMRILGALQKFNCS